MAATLSTLVHLAARFLMAWALLWLPAFPGMAQTVLTGTLTVDTHLSRAGSPYLINGELTVQSGALLTIEPGVTVYMGTGAGLKVEAGGVQAIGVFDEPIRVLSDKVRQGGGAAPGDWGQWVFNPGTVSTRLEHVVFEHGHGLAVYGAAPVFDYLTLRYHQGAAITVDLAASPSGEGNQASGNTLNGIAVPAGDITGTVKWAVRGIPYIVSSGIVSVGESPRITSVVPAVVEQGKPVTLTVSGRRLKEMIAAAFDKTGLSLTPFPGASDTQVSFQLEVDSSASPGPATLTLQVAAGVVTMLDAITVAYAKPFLESLAPAFIETGKTVTTLVVRGRNFAAQSEVLLNGAVVPAVFTSGAELKATVPAQSAEGILELQVRTPDPKVPGAFLLSNVLQLPVKAAQLPALSVEPNPIVLLPDGYPHQVVVQLDKPHSLDHTVTLEVSDSSRLSVSPASVTFLAGQTRMLVSLTPKMDVSGSNKLVLRSESLQRTLSVPVFVTRDVSGANTAFSELVGVTVGAAQPEVSVPVTVVHPTVGVAVGAVLTDVQPYRWSVGNTYTVVIHGKGIVPGARVAVVPDAGVTVEPPVVGPEGTQLEFTVSVAEDAAQGVRGIEVRDAANVPLVFADPERAMIQVTGALPEIESISPIQVVPGALVELVVRGRNLHKGTVQLSPATGMQIDQNAQINSDGTQLTVRIQVDSTAPLGSRAVQVRTSAGESGETASVTNTLEVVGQLLNGGRVVASVPVGVIISSTAEMVEQEMHGLPVGVMVGGGVAAVLPAQALVGSSQQVKVLGSGLSGVTSITLEPAEGTTVDAISVDPAGEVLDFTLHVEADAAVGKRRLVLNTVNGPVTFAAPNGDLFTLATSFPELVQVEPQVLAAGENMIRQMRVLGRNLHGMGGVRLEPPEGVVVGGPFTVNEAGTEAVFTVRVTAAALPGKRTVIVTANAGDSSPVATVGNSFLVANQVGPYYDNVLSAAVGVNIGTTGSVQPVDSVSQPVGVLIEEEVLPSERDLLAESLPVGVWLGNEAAVADDLSPSGWLQGASGVITVSGKALDQVGAAAVSPATGILLGALTVSEDGTQLQIPVSVAATAPEVVRELLLTTKDGQQLVFTHQSYGRFGIGRLPQIASVAPVQVVQGKSAQLVIRGTNLKGVTALKVEPEQGIQVVGTPVWQQDALGELLMVSIQIRPEAELGARVIRLEVPGGLTSGDATHFNTIGVLAP